MRIAVRPVKGLTTILAAGVFAAAAGFAVFDTAVPAYALGPGDVCLFNAPSGADVGLVAFGHVGWGYQIGGTSTWLFGATESPTYHWHSSGSETTMLADFANADYGHSANYYTQYKCQGTDSSAVRAASVAVSTGESNGYNGLTNNCLTKSVAIFNAYYPFGLYWGGYEGPNYYFDHLNWSGPFTLNGTPT